MISVVNMKYDNILRMTKQFDVKKYYVNLSFRYITGTVSQVMGKQRNRVKIDYE